MFFVGLKMTIGYKLWQRRFVAWLGVEDISLLRLIFAFNALFAKGVV